MFSSRLETRIKYKNTICTVRQQVFYQDWLKLQSILLLLRCSEIIEIFWLFFLPPSPTLDFFRVSIDLLACVSGGAHSIFNYSQLVSWCAVES